MDLEEQLAQARSDHAAGVYAHVVQPSPRREIGPYRLVREIEVRIGKQAAIYLAEDEAGAQVALKLLRRESCTEEAVARFQREAEILRGLDHPGIVRIRGSGYDGSHYYIAQEYVQDGHTLGTWLQIAAKAPADPAVHDRTVATLMAQVARALEEVHAAGVVHRDVKPSNILLLDLASPNPTPKLADFGIARLRGDADVTESGQVLGTPWYMSPEQVLGKKDLDHRSDVFSLGVVLYEALTLQRPFLGDKDLVRERIRRADPADPRKWRRDLPAPLAAICLRALERSSRRRYPTAGALAADLERFLRNEPVVARLPGWPTRAERWVRRNPWPTAVSLILAVASLLSFTQERRAVHAQERAAQEALVSKRVLGVITDLFHQELPDVARGRRITVREVLDSEAERVVGELADQPRAQALVMNSLGVLYANLSQYEDARRLLSASLTLMESGAADPSTATDARYALAEVLRDAGELKPARELHAQVLQERLRSYGPLHRETLRSRVAAALTDLESGTLEPALHEQEEVLARRIEVLPAGDPDILESQNNVGQALFLLGRGPEALAMQDQAAKEGVAALGADHPFVLLLRHNAAAYEMQYGDRDIAREALEELLPEIERVLGGQSRLFLMAELTRAALHVRFGELDQAAEILERVIASYEREFGASHLDTLTAWNHLAMVFYKLGEIDLMLETEASVFETAKKHHGADHPYTLNAQTTLATAHYQLKHCEEAARLLEDNVPRKRSKFGETHPDTLLTIDNLARVYLAMGEGAKALPLALEVHAASPEGTEHYLSRKQLVKDAKRAAGLPDDD